LKKILIITYYWPPAGGSGVQRWMYFAKYLPSFDFEPIIITVDEKYASYKQLDFKLNDNVKDIKVYKTKSIEILKIFSFLSSGNSKKAIPMGEIKSGKNGLFIKFAKYIRGSVFIPDARRGWNLYALKKSKKIIREEAIHTVITTGPPHSTHLIALKLKRKFSIKWIADFRDPWSDLYYNKEFIRTKRAVKKDICLEKKILESADMVLTVGNKLKELLQSKSDKIYSKIYHIFNGYDAELFNSIEYRKSDNFEISYIGFLSKNSPYETFVKSVKIFADAIENKNNIVLNLAGIIDESILKFVKKELSEIKINILGYLTHTEAVALMKKSNLLISCLPEMPQSKILVSGKTAEYIASGNPILSFGNPESESAEMLAELDYGLTCRKNEEEKAAVFIEEIYNGFLQKKNLYNNTNSDFIKNLSRLETTRKLSEILNNGY